MDPALRAWIDLVRAPEPEIDLTVGTLALARVEYPDLVVEHHVKHIDELAARSGTAGIDDPLRALHRLREFLFDEEGFRGNADDYYDPANSCLNRVLERKLGIPISLSVLMIEVGRRVGLRVHGVGLPGHFVVSATVGAESVLLDPFDGGTVLTQETAADVVARAVGRRVTLTAEHFAPVTKRHILVRMLANLKGAYVRREEWAKSLAIVDRLLVLDGSSSVFVRDRGSLLIKLGDLLRGAAEWERYLSAHPQAADAEKIKRDLRRVRQRLALLN
jgi:regulator of sirC expression with transglutaminase-like and TPR domain